MQKKTTIHDIARVMGVRASSVSRALNNHPRISTSLKERVKKMAKKMNYIPNPIASSLRTGKSKTIGVIVPRINRFFFAEAIHGIESVTEPAGYNLLICQSGESLKKEIKNIEMLLQSRVDGILLSVCQETKNINHLTSLAKQHIPFMLFDRIIETAQMPSVENNNFKGAYDAVSHLIQQGYKNIAHFGGYSHLKLYKDRLRGYKKALLDHHLKCNSDWVIMPAITIDDGEKAMQKILKMKKKPDAIFAAGDYAALSVIRSCKQSGIRIPQDMGVVGFANETFAEFIEPTLTTVEQYPAEIGASIARHLLNVIEKGTKKHAKQKPLMIDTKLIVRHSSIKKRK